MFQTMTALGMAVDRICAVAGATATGAVTPGCGPSVGIAGLTLGGGIGILGRKYGLTCDHLLRAQLVLADGHIVECNQHHDEELFWALRGAGGGHFGVVTSLVFRTLPAPTATVFRLAWPLPHASAVIQAWQAWAPIAPNELDATVRLTAGGDGERQTHAEVIGAVLGSETDAADLLDDLVARHVRADATAFAHRDELFLMQHLVTVSPDAPPTTSDAARSWLARSWALVHPWGSGGVYPNFPDPDLEDWARAYHGGNYDRLVRAKARYDPDNFFRFHQSLPTHTLGDGKHQHEDPDATRRFMSDAQALGPDPS